MGYDAALKESQELSRKGGKTHKDSKVEYTGEKNKFVGYDQLTFSSKVVALYAAGTPVQELKAGQAGIVVLDTTPFYAESGGQVGDQGVITLGRGQLCRQRHPENPGRRIRPPWRAGIGRAEGGRRRLGAKSTRPSARAPSATTRPRT